MNSALYALLAVAAIVGVICYLYQQQKTPTEQQLKDWLAYIEAGGVLSETDYTAIDKLFPPSLKARYLNAVTKTRNSYAARAITVELIQRERSAGRHVTSRQLEILTKEGISGIKAESKTPVPPPEGEEKEDDDAKT